MKEQRTILLVEDDRKLLDTTRRILEQKGYAIRTAFGMADARRAMEESIPDLLVTNILIPDGNGIALCREIREYSDVPVIFLTAPEKAADAVIGLRAGGDDYLTKPVNFDELEARIEVLLRRARRTNREMLVYPPLAIDLSLHRAWLDGEDALLTPREYQMLALLAKNIGRPVSGEWLFEKLWPRSIPGSKPGGDIHTVHVHISALRKKLKMTEESAVQIKTIRNRGYCFIHDRKPAE